MGGNNSKNDTDNDITEYIITEDKITTNSDGLISINLSKCSLLEIPDLSMYADKLISLDLSYTNIRKIKVLDNLLELQELDLSYNNITEINGVERLTNLKHLSLENNFINIFYEFKKLKNELNELKNNLQIPY